MELHFEMRLRSSADRIHRMIRLKDTDLLRLFDFKANELLQVLGVPLENR